MNIADNKAKVLLYVTEGDPTKVIKTTFLQNLSLNLMKHYI